MFSLWCPYPTRVAAFAAVALSCLAQTAEPPLTVDDCIRKALAVPSTVSLARKDRDIADLDRTQARAGFLPQSAITSGYAYNSPSRADRSVQSFVALNGAREFTALANIFQEIDTSGRLRADYARARAGQQVAAASLAIAERDLKRAVASAYYRLLLARHVRDAIRTSLEESQAFERRAKLLFDGGEAARADVVKASAQVAFLRQSLSTAELAAQLANQDLAAYWTREVAAPLNLVEIFDAPLPAAEGGTPAEAAPFLRRFEFSLLDAEKKMFQSEARGAKANLYPQLSWNYQYGLDVNRVAWNNRGYAAFVNLNIPVFDWFKSLSVARQFQARAAQTMETRDITERRLSGEYQSALSRVRLFREQIAQCQSQVELGEEDLKLSRVRYEGGEGAALDVVVAQNQLAQARTNYYSSIANYFTARLDLEVASGR